MSAMPAAAPVEREMETLIDSLADACVGEAPRRGRPAAGQDPAKRSQILEGARQVFIDVGFDAASMNDITRAAGVSKGTIYVYFENKEDLFEALIEEERRTIFADLYEALDRNRAVRPTLIAFCERLVRKITSPKVISAQRTVIGICDRKPELGARFYERGPKNGHAKLSGYLRAVAERGELAIPDIELAAYQLTDLSMAGIFRQRLFGYRNDPPSDEEMRRTATAAVDMFLKAYAGLAIAG
jgi:AcrR family transcriptional regulator